MRRAEMGIGTDLMRMHGAQVAIASLAARAAVVALEAARRAATFDRAAWRAPAAARADDSGKAAGQAKGRAGHQRVLASMHSATRRAISLS